MNTLNTIDLPAPNGQHRTIELAAPAVLETSSTRPVSRIVYAAGHVVADPLLASAGSSAIDWDATLKIRHSLWDLGLGVAESMDTAQRGMGLGPKEALTLARRTLAEARAVGGSVVVGIATDQLGPGPHPLTEIADAYIEQLGEVEEAGGSVVMMASRHLALSATGPDDYLHRVAGSLLYNGFRFRPLRRPSRLLTGRRCRSAAPNASGRRRDLPPSFVAPSRH